MAKTDEEVKAEELKHVQNWVDTNLPGAVVRPYSELPPAEQQAVPVGTAFVATSTQEGKTATFGIGGVHHTTTENEE